MFFCVFCEIFKNSCFLEHPRTIAISWTAFRILGWLNSINKIGKKIWLDTRGHYYTTSLKAYKKQEWCLNLPRITNFEFSKFCKKFLHVSPSCQRKSSVKKYVWLKYLLNHVNNLTYFKFYIYDTYMTNFDYLFVN